jgi:hypothetical protein
MQTVFKAQVLIRSIQRQRVKVSFDKRTGTAIITLLLNSDSSKDYLLITTWVLRKPNLGVLRVLLLLHQLQEHLKTWPLQNAMSAI